MMTVWRAELIRPGTYCSRGFLSYEDAVNGLRDMIAAAMRIPRARATSPQAIIPLSGVISARIRDTGKPPRDTRGHVSKEYNLWVKLAGDDRWTFYRSFGGCREMAIEHACDQMYGNAPPDALRLVEYRSGEIEHTWRYRDPFTGRLVEA